VLPVAQAVGPVHPVPPHCPYTVCVAAGAADVVVGVIDVGVLGGVVDVAGGFDDAGDDDAGGGDEEDTTGCVLAETLKELVTRTALPVKGSVPVCTAWR